jgi:hypothetical protein
VQDASTDFSEGHACAGPPSDCTSPVDSVHYTMPPHDLSSVVPPTPSTTHSRSTSQMSIPFSSMQLQLENTPCPSSPPPTLHKLPSASDHVIDEMSDIEDSDSDTDLSPILNALTVSSMTHTFQTSFQFLSLHH